MESSSYNDDKNNRSCYTITHCFKEDPEGIYTLIDITREKEFYNLLFQLNADIIKNFTVTEKDDFNELVIVTVDIGNDDPNGANIFDDGEEIKMRLNTLTSIISDETITINSVNSTVIEEDEDEEEDESIVLIEDVNISITRKDNNVYIKVYYSVDYDSLEYIKEFTNLFIKKLFHRLVSYFKDNLSNDEVSNACI
jgi:hypothetical protein